MEDKLLKMMFADKERWSELVNKSCLKGISKGFLRNICTPQEIARLYKLVRDEQIMFEPAHQAAIPKDEPGEFRIVYVGSPIERVLCSLINDCLFELFPDMVHKSCWSYQKHIGTGKVVKEAIKFIGNCKGNVIGAKFDFHHYFDTVNKDVIFEKFDEVEKRLGFEKGTESVMNLLRKTWNNDIIQNLDKEYISQWSGIRQGNAIGSWLADTVLYELDEYMSSKYKFYCRYSDDLIVLGENVEEITEDIQRIVSKFGVSLNLKKTETLKKDTFFKFLGFGIRGTDITISKGRLDKFVKKIYSLTIKSKRKTLEGVVNDVNYFLYGKGDYSWATSLLGIITIEEDIELMNSFIQDCIRAWYFNKRHKKFIGGLGYNKNGKVGALVRGTGSSVTTMRTKMPIIKGYKSLGMMRNAILTDKDLYRALIAA